MRILVHSPAQLSICFWTVIRPGPDLHSLTFQADSGQSKALEFLQKRALSSIFPGSEYATNLIIVNVDTLSHDDSNSHSFSSDGHEFGGVTPWPPMDPPLALLP